MASCGAEPAPEAAAPATPPASEQTTPPAASTSVEPASKRAEAALRAQRLFAPAGDNAFELFVQAMTEQPGDERARNALQDLVPYAVLHVEQRLAARDRAEATRVLALLALAQGDAPALPRLRQAVLALPQETREQTASVPGTAMPADAATVAMGIDPRADAQPPTHATADSSNASATPTTGIETSVAEAHRPDTASSMPAPAPPAAVAEEPDIAAPASPAEAAATSSTAAPDATTADALPRILRQVAPRYPPVAGRRGQEGEVEVAFTIHPDGRVGDVVVIRSDPPRVFDRAAIAAMEDWRYEAPGRSVRSSRTFAFRMD